MRRRSNSQTQGSTAMKFANVELNEEEALLMAIARSNHAKRKIKLTLEDRCLRTIAQNDEYFVKNAAQASILGNGLMPPLKTRILAELSEQIFGKPRYPATKHRVEMVKLLIHPRLEEFDFAACGFKFGKAANQQVWKCLAEKAGQRLRCIKDMRIKSHTQKTRTLAWCLPFLAFMPRLEKLLLTTQCCYTGELEDLVKSAPQLKTLQLLLHNSFELDEINPVVSMKALEELVFYSYKKGQVPSLLPKLLAEMPQLKVNGLRTDEICPNGFYIWHERGPATRAGPLNLEHFSMSANAPADKKFNYGDLPNVKHLMLEGEYFNLLRPGTPNEDYSVHFRQLETIHLRNCDFSRCIVRILSINGAAISTLVLDSKRAPSERYDLYWVLAKCPNLTTLKVNKAEVMEYYDFLPEQGHLKLRVLHLVRCDLDNKFLGWVLTRAPMLEQLVLESIDAYEGDAFYRGSVSITDDSSCLASLRSLKFTLYCSEIFGGSNPLYRSALEFVVRMMTLSPNLQQAAIDLNEDRYEEKFLKYFVSLVNG